MYEINISNDDKLRAVLARLGAAISPALLLPAIGEEVLNNHRARHQKSQAPDGGAWARLKPSTLAKKKGPLPLFERGDMLGRPFYQVSSNAVTLGTVDHKAIWHHFGTRSKSGGVHLPARPLFGFEQPDRDAVHQMLVDIIKRANPS